MGDTEVSVRLSQLEEWLKCLNEVEKRLKKIEDELISKIEKSSPQQEEHRIIWSTRPR